MTNYTLTVIENFLMIEETYDYAIDHKANLEQLTSITLTTL